LVVLLILYLVVHNAVESGVEAGAKSAALEALKNLPNKKDVLDLATSVHDLDGDLHKLDEAASAIDERLVRLRKHMKRIERASNRSAVLLVEVGALVGIVGGFFGPWVLEGGAVFDLNAFVRGFIVLGLTIAALIPIGLYLNGKLDEIFGSDSPGEAA
jgi:hypothetical protein